MQDLKRQLQPLIQQSYDQGYRAGARDVRESLGPAEPSKRRVLEEGPTPKIKDTKKLIAHYYKRHQNR